MSAGPATLLGTRRGDYTVNGWTVVETYQVITTDSTDGPDVVLTASGLPAFYAASSIDPLARAARFSPNQQPDATVNWHVEVTYERETGNQLDQQNPPTLRPVKRSTQTRWVEKALMQDVDGNPILTGAKTPFDPPLTVQVPHAVAIFQRWEATFSSATKDAYEGKVNSSSFGAYAAGRVLCTGLNGDEQWEQDASGNLQRYWLVTYEFEASQSWDPWRPFKVLDQDIWFIDPADSKRKLIYVDSAGYYGANNDGTAEANAVPVPRAIPLAASPAGDILQPSELPDSAHYLEFNIYQQADFNALALPVY